MLVFIFSFTRSMTLVGRLAENESRHVDVRFLAATNADDRARFDWMGYVGSFIAIAAFIPLPFAGYWLGREIYQFSEQMGVSMMGGSFAWLNSKTAVIGRSICVNEEGARLQSLEEVPGARAGGKGADAIERPPIRVEERFAELTRDAQQLVTMLVADA